jgi:F-type H+-transporting ATPase subunit a
MILLPWIVYVFYGAIACVILTVIGVVINATASARYPSRFQIFMELILDNVRDLLSASLGEGGESHLPLVITLFLFILVCDVLGQIPLFKSATSSTSTTLGLGLISFCYVQFVGIKSNGLWGYLKHFGGPASDLKAPSGNGTGVPGYIKYLLGLVLMLALFLPIEIIGEFAKPFSLGMRLFGNIYGEDVINGLATTAGQKFFIPVQFVVYFLQLFTDLIQAVIFSLLTSAYISVFTSSHHQTNIDIPHQDENNGDVVGRIPAEFSKTH